MCGAALPERRWTHGNRKRKSAASHNRHVPGTAFLQYAGGDTVTPGECDNYSHSDAGGRTAAESRCLAIKRKKETYVRAFDKMLQEREKAGLKNRETWSDGEHVMRWWVGDDPNQVTIFDFMDEAGIDY